MKERPIIISTQLIPPTLDGRKTMTRRPLDPQPSCARVELYSTTHWMKLPPKDRKRRIWVPTSNSGKVGIFEKPYYTCPYGQPGDRLWVRETYCVESNMNIAGNKEYPPPFNDGRPVQHHMDLDWGSFWDQCHYKATDPIPELAYEDTDQPTVRWKPSIHMPRWASRITLEIVNVRVERLQEITEEDARKEGFKFTSKRHIDWVSAMYDFRKYWNSLYTKKPEYQSKADPWVWVVEFRQLL